MLLKNEISRKNEVRSDFGDLGFFLNIFSALSFLYVRSDFVFLGSYF